MSDAREKILTRIRARKIKDNKGQIPVRQKHCLPQQIECTPDELFELFCKNVVRSSATYDLLAQIHSVPTAVDNYLNQFTASSNANSDKYGVHLNSPLLTELSWPEHKPPHSNINNAFASVTIGYCGIAETGSVALVAEAGHNTAAYFLPEILIIVLNKKDILASQEACWNKIREDYEHLPRTITLATGPSRTGDIEQKLIIGAHGPRHEHLLIIDN